MTLQVTPPGPQEIPLSMFIQCTRKNNKPSLELRRTIVDQELLKFIIRCALTHQTIIIHPEFSNDMISLAKLCEIGILYKKDDKFFFTF